MTCDWIAIEPKTAAAVAMAPCPGFWAGSMWELQIERPASVRVDGDLEGLLCRRGIGAVKLDTARAKAVYRGAVTWRGRYQEEALDWLDERHGPGLKWAETKVQTSAGDVPALLALSGKQIVACIAPLGSAAKAKRFMGATLHLHGKSRLEVR